jgi:hypothetical protein
MTVGVDLVDAAADVSPGVSLQEVGEQLLDDLGLIDHHHMVRVVDQLDPCVGQLPPEAVCRL